MVNTHNNDKDALPAVDIIRIDIIIQILGRYWNTGVTKLQICNY